VTPRSWCARTCTPTATLTLATPSRATNARRRRRCAAGASSRPAERRRRRRRPTVRCFSDERGQQLNGSRHQSPALTRRITTMWQLRCLNHTHVLAPKLLAPKQCVLGWLPSLTLSVHLPVALELVSHSVHRTCVRAMPAPADRHADDNASFYTRVALVHPHGRPHSWTPSQRRCSLRLACARGASR